MLTAQKENSPLDNEPLPQRPPSARSFDKVVNSIEGLRERVEGFTLEQVSEMEQRLRTMSLKLGEVQRTVKALLEIKQRMSRIQKAVQQAEAERLESGRLATLMEPAAIQSIARVGTLLKFQRVIKLLKEAKSGSEVSVSTDSEAKNPPIPKPIEVMPATPKNKQELGDFLAVQHELASDEITVDAVSGPLDESETALHTALVRVNFEPVFSKPLETISAPLTNEQELTIDSPAIEQSTANETPVDVTSEELEQHEASLHPSAGEMDFESNEPFSNAPGSPIFDESTTLTEPREIIAEFADTRDDPLASHPIYEAEPEIAAFQTQTETSEDADFDQRLLDDLIKNYGEFSISSRSTLNTETNKGPETTVTPQVVSAPVIAPTQPNLPLPRKDGELDRKLKKLIKDYGEYDLYSRQTPLKLKTGIVAAFLFLTLVFSGFYFFTSHKSALPTTASSGSQAQISSETAPKETAPHSESASGDTLSPSSSNIDLSKPIEAGVSQNVANKGTTKKTTK